MIFCLSAIALPVAFSMSTRPPAACVFQVEYLWTGLYAGRALQERSNRLSAALCVYHALVVQYLQLKQAVVTDVNQGMFLPLIRQLVGCALLAKNHQSTGRIVHRVHRLNGPMEA
jgi:hypothetical protein